MEEEKIGGVRRVLGFACHYCPLCRSARKNPESMLGRALHHPWHAEHCPMWKAEKAVYPPEFRE